jgi:putative addiction module component (TIGR02574 family)
MSTPDASAFDELPAAERLRLVVDLWERLAKHPEDVPITAAQLEELEHRLDDADAHPETGIPLEVARERLRRA